MESKKQLIQPIYNYELNSNQKRDFSILDSLADGVISLTLDLTIDYINPSAIELLNETQGSINKKPISDFFSHNDEAVPKISKKLQQCLTEKNVIHFKNLKLIGRSGRNIPVEGTISPLFAFGKKVTGLVLLIRDISNTNILHKKLKYQATHDSLTGLRNRHYFEEHLEKLRKNSIEKKVQHALLYIDLDQFKIVNDTSGHIAGDELLKQVSHIISSEIRTTDTLARLGGDEFGILLNNCSLENALALAEKIRARVEDFHFIWESKHFQIGSSIGVTIIDKDSAMLNILSLADIACYSAKDSGRNRVHLYTHEDEELAKRQSEMNIFSKITEALEENRFVLYAQPIISLTEKYVNDEFYEVLVRMIDTDDILIPPGAFLSAAERYGLMPKIDRYVIEQAIECLEKSENKNISLSINLSGISINSKELTEFIEGRFHRYSLSERICFEITESTAITNILESKTFFERLKKLGFTISLDDFGSGLASFDYLKNLPIDILKIDGSFVKQMHTDNVDAAMVEAIIRVSQEMGIQTVAEYVENQATIDLLKIYGVDFAQGYAIQKPFPLSELNKV